MIVVFTIDIPRVDTTKDAQDFCKSLAEEMVQSATNMENDIKTIQYTVPKTRGNA